MNIVIFIKAPIPGRVKTRLHPVLSPAQATALYRSMAQNTIDQACRVRSAYVVVAYDVHPDHADPSWLKGNPVWIPQKGRNLGERLTSAAHEIGTQNPGPTLLIGSDLPDLTAELLEQAKKALETHDLVIGPARDGGYYLIGFQTPQPLLFENIPWSGPAVLSTTLAIAKTLRLSMALLPEKTDLDTPEDYERLRGILHAHHPV